MTQNQTVHVNHDGKIKQCLVQNVFKREKGKDEYVLKVDGTNDEYLIAYLSEIFTSAEECKKASNAKFEKEYNSHYSQFKTLEELLVYLLHAATTRKICSDAELAAAVNRASEFTKMDMMVYLEKYADDVKKEAN